VMEGAKLAEHCLGDFGYRQINHAAQLNTARVA